VEVAMFSIGSAPGLYNGDPMPPCAGDKQKSYINMRIDMFVVFEKVKPDVKNIGVLRVNLAAVKFTNVQVTKLPL
jgi:hypothetical protein